MRGAEQYHCRCKEVARLSQKCITVPKQGPWQDIFTRLSLRCTTVPLQAQGGDTAGLEVHSSASRGARQRQGNVRSASRGARQRQGNVRSAQDSLFVVVQFYKLTLYLVK